MMAYLLDGSAQFSLLGVVLAAVAYIRNIPYKELKARLSDATGKPLSAAKCCWINAQMLLLDFMQIVLAGVGVMLVGRFQLGDVYDVYILLTLWILAGLLLLMHIMVNGRNIIRTLFK
jgi:hypothetical protein